VIDEMLRLVNISFVAFRQATKDVFVNGKLRALHSETSQL
jgi:ent-kaurenoic acid hydroxylase